MTDWKTKKVALGLAVLAGIIRLAAFSAFHDSVFYTPAADSGHDRALYMRAAEAVAQGKLVPDGAFAYLPLYPWLLGVTTHLFPSTAAAAAALGMVADSITVFLIVLLAARLGAGTVTAGAAGLAYAAYPLAIVYSLLAMPNTLNALGLTVFAYVMMSRVPNDAEVQGRIPPLRFFTLGLLAGVLTLGFAGMMLIAMVAAGYAALRTRSLAPLLLIAGMALPVAPVAIHNTRAEGSFVLLTTHGGFNYYMGNHERATGYPLRVLNFRMTAQDMLEDAHHHAETQAGRPLTSAESSAWWKEQAGAFWRAHPAQALLLTVKKALIFWNTREVDDLRMREQLRITEPFFRRLAGVPFSVIGVMGLTSVLFLRGGRELRIILLAGMAGLVLFFITSRYRLTFVPLLCVLGGGMVAQLVDDWRKGRRSSVIALIPALVVVFLPFRIPDQRPVDHYNTAVELSRSGDPARALEVIARGLEIAPHYAPLHFIRGNTFFALGDYVSAAEALGAAHELDPSNLTVTYNLTLSLARGGDYCAARDVLREARESGLVLDARMQNLLAELEKACP